MYRHRPERSGSGSGSGKPWALVGQRCGRGPDNEPRAQHVEPITWIAGSVIEEAETEVVRQRGT
ncbi:DUF6098 family protein [Streptomyces sp. NPDC048639]|uniref:DUF6098 family protein n=1 Tax=Streptomyces sp. NPDC048639 TaxID=3365581 RepID=UPI003716DCA2